MVISSFDDFGFTEMKLIRQAGLENQFDIFHPNHWPAFASALSFLTKKIYRSPEGLFYFYFYFYLLFLFYLF